MTRIVAMIVSLLLIGPAMGQGNPLVVHEWGTFTSLQDETGKALGGVAEDIEPLPSFVSDLFPAANGKGYPSSLANAITMRLETPVVYFHLPRGSGPINLTFRAEFRGGLITQYYPAAEAGIPANATSSLTEKTTGSMTWNDLRIGMRASGPPTTSPVWLAPRDVDADNITARNGQSERYLFYRGIGHLNAPVTVTRNGSELQLHTLQVQTAWYFDVRPDGTSAYRKLTLLNADLPSGPATTPADFDPGEFSFDNLAAMRADMKQSIIEAGLFADEAEAMLKTWENAYFKSAGTRLFFVVPRAWTDRYLPISLSVPAKVERVMIGRIDLVTPQQRQIARAYLALGNTNSTQARMLLAQLGRFAGPIVANERASRLPPAQLAPAP